MPVPRVTHRTNRWPAPAPNRLSPSAAVLASLSTTTGIGSGAPDRAAQRLVAPGQVRREHHRATGSRRRSRRRRCRPPRRRTAAGAPGPARRWCPRPPTTSCPSVGRRCSSTTVPRGVDDAGQDLGAADVDADGQRVPEVDPRAADGAGGGAARSVRTRVRLPQPSQRGPGRRRRSARRGCRAGPCGSRGRAGARARSAGTGTPRGPGSSSRSPASLTPPPITTTAGSRTAVSEAMPSPSQRPRAASCSIANGSPARAASVISGPVIRSGSPPARSSSAPGEQRARPGPRPRASRTSALPLAYCSKQPRLPQPQQQPVGHHPHVADLRADAEGAAEQLAVVHDAAADAGADRDQQQVVDVVAGAEGELAPGGGVRVVLDHDGQVDARLEVGLEVDVAPGDVGREHHRRPGPCRRSPPRRRRPRRSRAAT